MNNDSNNNEQLQNNTTGQIQNPFENVQLNQPSQEVPAPSVEQAPMPAQEPATQSVEQAPMPVQEPVENTTQQVEQVQEIQVSETPTEISNTQVESSTVQENTLPQTQAELPNNQVAPVINNNSKKSSKAPIIIVVLLLIAACCGGYFLLNNGSGDSGTKNESEGNNDKKDATLLEDFEITGHSCINSKCSVFTGFGDDEDQYNLDIENTDLFLELDNYEDYIKVNIYYTEKENKKTIVDYEIVLNSTKEKITGVKTEDELREKIGLPSVGSHNAELTLTDKSDTPSIFIDDENSYSMYQYTFVDDNNLKYEMDYKTNDANLDLEIGKKYNVTYEVVKDDFGYDIELKEAK